MGVKKPRVAIYGGDERNERLSWPEHLDIQLYPYKSPRSVDRLKESISTGSIDHLVVLTSYVGHGYLDGLKGFENTTRWPKSPGELSRQLGRMFPPPKDTNPLLIPTTQDHPGTGGGRGPIATKEAIMAEERANVPMFEHIVDIPAKPDETFGQALLRIIASEGISQAYLARTLDKDPATINGWVKDRGLPKDMGPLVDLWPELARFDKEHTYKAPPTQPPAAVETRAPNTAELAALIQRGKAKSTPVSSDPGRLINSELAGVLARWRKQKEELETTERYLLLLLRDSGL